MTEEEIDDEVCRIMREHGPDGHIDGHDMLTEMVVRRVAEEVAAERERWAALHAWLLRSVEEYKVGCGMSIAESIHGAGAMREVLAQMAKMDMNWANVREAIKNGLRAARTEEL